MNTPTPNQNPVPGQVPEVGQVGISAEGQQVPRVSSEVVQSAPEVRPAMAPEPSVEQVGSVPSSPPPVQPNQAQDQSVQPQGQPQDPALIDDQTQVDISETPETDIERKYVKKADETIENLEDKPYEEELAYEDLQTGYLRERFGKVLRKSEDK